MKLRSTGFAVLAALCLCSSGLAAGSTRDQLKEIGDNADVANGGSEIKEFNPGRVDFDALFNKDLKVVKKEYPECGPYRTAKYRRDTMGAIRKVAHDDPTADALEKLYAEKKILKMYSIWTNNEIDCSRMWVEVFTVDGNQLEIYYGMND